METRPRSVPGSETEHSRKLDDFEGRWQVLRRITPRQGPPARFEGHAVWSPVAGGLAYHETGTMQLDGHPPMQAERRYVWASDLSVHFEDGRFFHRVPPLGGTARHRCDPDDYILTYDFARWPLFRVTWQVRGPRKDYHAETEYTRR